MCTMRHRNFLQSFSRFFVLLLSTLKPYLSSSATLQSLSGGSSLSVENPTDILVSPDCGFSAGFYNVGDNAYCFAIWYTKPANLTVVWMANRDHPVNGKRSALYLRSNGNLVLTDAGFFNVWATNTTSISSVQLRLLNTGNLVLQTSSNTTLWQSFDFPTDTLLPQQLFTRFSRLIALRSRYNYSSGLYTLYFDNDNVLRLLFNGPDTSSFYWPDPAFLIWQSGRTSYNNSRIAEIDVWGFLLSTDDLKIFPADYGVGPRRRLTLDFDGNLRIYSLDEKKGSWEVSWQAISQSCRIHGTCGPNGICDDGLERRCTCPPGFKVKNPSDWTQGCEPTFDRSCDPQKSKFIRLPALDFYGYDINYEGNITLESCRRKCLELCSCKAFMYRQGAIWECYPKTMLLNGIRSPDFKGTMYVRVALNITAAADDNRDGQRDVIGLNCPTLANVELVGVYESHDTGESIKSLVWFAAAVGGVEMIFIFIGWWYLYRKNDDHLRRADQVHLYAALGFRKFTYAELKGATSNFIEEIGRGGGGVVYKGVLPDKRVAAVKRLEGLNQGEEEFLAEVSTIGRINHMNLIQMWGFCAEGKHKLLVYEYHERGSLAENLSSNFLDWKKRYKIAVGMAKGLAYLHDECLEWVLHCDIKPQNILLDAKYNAKVSDFGLSKLRDRAVITNPSFSRIRGTRGYMAPEWILNLPITSKVDVYSYGIVVLELITGKQATESLEVDEGGERLQLIPWVKEKIGATSTKPWKIEEIIDPKMSRSYNVAKVDALIRVALQCVEEENNARPTMSQVVEMLTMPQKLG